MVNTPDEPKQIEKPQSRILATLSHPALLMVTLIGSIASLISIPLAIYFYTTSTQRPQLTYYVHPVKATIVRAGEASRLMATFDNKAVNSDITAAQVAIWNEGRQSIKSDQVLKPDVIYTENNTPILEATIRKSSRDVTQLSLNTDDLQKGRVSVHWNILEQNDGGVVQLVYGGSPDVRIQTEGVIESQPQIKRLEFSGKIATPSEQYESEQRAYKYWGYLLFTVVAQSCFYRPAFRAAV